MKKKTEQSVEQPSCSATADQHAVAAELRQRLAELEAQVALQHEKFVLAFHNSPNGFYISTLQEGRYIDCNESFSEVTGFRRDEMIGCTSLELNIWVDPERRRQMCSIVDEHGVVQQFEFRFRRKDGEVRSGVFSASLITIDGLPCILGEFMDVTDKKRIEEELHRSLNVLEERVRERTASLEKVNKELLREVAERRKAEDELREKAAQLTDVNTALRVLLRRNREERLETEERLAANIRHLVSPHIDKLRRLHRGEAWAGLAHVEALESSLADVVSPAAAALCGLHYQLSAVELHVASLIRQGKSSKEIAAALFLSPRTIESHRKSIRKKLGLQKSKTNLRTYLVAIQNHIG